MARTIVLLSDGTGNSAAKLFKTNVWRLYQALDIAAPGNPGDLQQIAYYDDGVGTDNWKPLALLGSAFGFGVWRNVKDLYTFVCRNHGPGDRIYAFGFSRGAFTVRLLLGLIGRCGIVRTMPQSEENLLKAVDMACEAYKRDFLLRASRQRGMIYHLILKEPEYAYDPVSKSKWIKLPEPVEFQSFVDIPFLGVWDTVDAYGMPIDEMKLGIDRWVWPMSVADREPAPRVTRIRHALSLDDERPTFRPVLWTHKIKNPEHPGETIELDPARIQQVWFAGVHANVGGSYPDDSLSYVALDWMMREAELTGLRFIKWVRDDIHIRADTHGKQYDSRAGLAGYYRYGPRKVSALCKDAEYGVDVRPVKVHASVYDRIALHHVEYAPVSLDCGFELVNAAPVSANTPPDLQPVLQPDPTHLEYAWDIVWWRRLAYFSTVGLTCFLGVYLLGLFIPELNVILKFTEDLLTPVWLWLVGWFGAAAGSTAAIWGQWLLDKAGGFLPFGLGIVMPAVKTYPLSAVVALVLLAWLFFKVSGALQRRIDAHAEWAWAGQKSLPLEHAPAANWLNAVGRFMRPVTAALYVVWRKVVANVLGIVIGVVALIAMSPFWIWRVFRRRPWMA